MAFSFVFICIFLFWIAVHLFLESKAKKRQLAWAGVLWFFLLPFMLLVGTLAAIDIEDAPSPISSSH
jgi:hypothetical protein